MHGAAADNHPRARAREVWNPASASDVVDATGRSLRGWHEVESVVGDVVTFGETAAEPDAIVLRVDRTSLRFLDVATLDAFLADAGFEIDAQFGDWHHGPVTDASREIITVARASGRGPD